MSKEGAKKSKKPKKGEGLWLMSFSDMTLTLMCFFVLMISTMVPNKQKFQNIKDGMDDHKIPQRSLKEIAQYLQEVINKKDIQKTALVNYDADGLRIEFKDGILFESASAVTNNNFLKLAQEVFKIISTIDPKYNLAIEGHTDDMPLGKDSKFQTNWELSASRGITLLHILESFGVSQNRISVIAYAHTRPKVSIEGLTQKQLQKARAANRRVVIRIE